MAYCISGEGLYSATERDGLIAAAGQVGIGPTFSAASVSREKGNVVEDADEAVVAACRQGDADAFVVLVKRYQNLIMRQIRWYARDPAAGEELLHDVFVQAYLSLPTYSAKAPFRNWLRKIASHVCYHHLKNQYRAGRFFPLTENDAVVPEKIDRLDPDQAKDLLHQLLARLSPEDRMVLTLMYLENLGTKEIAERMGWNRAMVKMRAYRAKRKLRTVVESEGWTEKYELLLNP